MSEIVFVFSRVLNYFQDTVVPKEAGRDSYHNNYLSQFRERGTDIKLKIEFEFITLLLCIFSLIFL